MKKSIYHENDRDETKGADPVTEAPLLVSSSISERALKGELHLYPKTACLKRGIKSMAKPPKRNGTVINNLSRKSQSRLRFTATNAGAVLCSQFGLTYHEKWPADGRELKRHLHNFLTALKRRYKGIQYLWLVEFQSRGCPHVHLFLNLPATDADAHDFMARSWARIVDLGNDSLLAVHLHSSNFIAWEMRRGSYLCGYRGKKAQKCIPTGFANFGRFWGNSRNLIPPPEIISLADLDDEYGSQTVDEHCNVTEKHRPSVIMKRILDRYHEKQNNRSFHRKRTGSVSVLTGAPIARQLLGSLQQQRPEGSYPLNAHIAGGGGQFCRLSGEGMAWHRMGLMHRWSKLIDALCRSGS